MPKPQVNAAVVEILETMLAAAKAGHVSALWVVYRMGEEDYDSAYETNDLDDMLVQVRTEIINTQSALGALHAAPRPN
ncbi:hypothetical protein [Lysobacter enzymogenes]|uniref:hypothetical protein n=1 Tax=Lysobacter enzymogenes TaxID=69 RepID=UPI001A9706EE|nr:hypothetical protein [Lysobacter enzymogenes]QQP96533.1 hypothetical protein JHW38_00295 [Lysobacter enzymogenes]